ncbi:hypothetical protein CEXT_592321 [Caerostris extrusa]|uniref:Uncharacterized protein n=1 Tax=Caerostris extrusa TaxID=172846 RepID=A0AAV4XU77_CAEEX|nr:hypothetical protein CEXT_592321 [Caerostris extrusa]
MPPCPRGTPGTKRPSRQKWVRRAQRHHTVLPFWNIVLWGDLLEVLKVIESLLVGWVRIEARSPGGAESSLWM